MKIYIARHGQTPANASKIIQGCRIDESLTEEGRRQAEALRDIVKRYNFDIILASTLKRASETAEIVSNGIVPIEYFDELKELDLGSFSGKRWSDIENGKELRRIHVAQKFDYRPQGGENVVDFENRFKRIVDHIKTHLSDKKVLIVAHSGIIRLAQRLYNEREVDTSENASLEEFEI